MLTLLGTVTYYWSKNDYLNYLESRLSQNIDLLSISLTNLNNLGPIIKTFKKKTGLRISIISQAGEVIANSYETNGKIQNQANKYEIIHAKYEGYGKNIRFSKALKKELFYVAKKMLINNNIYYIRLSAYTTKAIGEFERLFYQILGVIALIIIIFFLSTRFLSTRIKNEMDIILNYLTKLGNQKIHSEIYCEFCEEFGEIAKLLNEVANISSKREKQKLKQTAKLKLANKQKDEIISAISHEFKNPIAVISGYSETILNDESLPQAMKKEFISKIYSNAQKVNRMIDKLKLISRLEKDKQEVTTQEYSINKLCQDVASNLKIKYANRVILLRGNEKKLNVDVTLFSMALENLIENALKYSKKEIVVKTEKNSLHVIDKGIGIEKSELKMINQKFYRVSQNDWNNSLGLGLFIVCSILKLHKFDLEIKSEIDVGSEFIIKY